MAGFKALCPAMNPAAPVQIWSAVPTPLLPTLEVDVPSVRRLIQDAREQAIDGLFLAGTCGEGPWLPEREKARLIETAVEAAGGKLKIAAQVSDNSIPRIRDNVALAAAAGADYVVIAPPATFMNATPQRVVNFFRGAVEASTLPVGIYDMGKHRPIMIPEEHLVEIYCLPNVAFVKDSSAAPERRQCALEARQRKPGLRLLNGDEFHCLDYLQAGYDGFMFGGAVAVPEHLRQIAAYCQADCLSEAQEVEADMRRILFGIYGGEKIACWLTGLKHLLVCRGIFSSAASFLEYPLTDECRTFIEAHARETAAVADAK